MSVVEKALGEGRSEGRGGEGGRNWEVGIDAYALVV